MTRYVKPGQTVFLHGTLSAYGTLIAEAGTMAKPGALIELQPGYAAENIGVIDLQGTSRHGTAPATLLDRGTLTNDGTLTAGGGYAPGQGALLNIAGTLFDYGLVTIGAGGFGGGALGTIAPRASLIVGRNGGVLTLQASSYRQAGSGATLIDSGLLDNRGTFEVLGAKYSRDANYTSANLSVTATGTLENEGTLSGGSGFQGYENGTLTIDGVLLNSGSMALSGAPWVDTGPITNTGTITSFAKPELSGVLTNSGLMELYDGFTQAGSIFNSGTMYVGDGTLFSQVSNSGVFRVNDFSQLTIASGCVFTNNDKLIVAAGTYDDFSGVYGIPGSLVIAAEASLVNNATLTIAGVLYEFGFDLGGVMDVYGVLSNNGDIQDQGGVAYYKNADISIERTGTLLNNGSVQIGAGQYDKYYPAYFGAGAKFYDDGAVTNAGTIVIAGGTGRISGTLEVTATGSLTDTGLIGGTGTLINQGIISTGGYRVTTGTLQVANLVNDGTIVVGSHGVFVVGGTVTTLGGAAGSFDLPAHGTLTFGNPVDAGQSVYFLGQAAQLSLVDPIAFAGTLDGLQAYDQIDFVDLDVITAATAGDSIDLGLANGVTFSLALDAPLIGLSLHLKSDGDGGTYLLFHPATTVLPAAPVVQTHAVEASPPSDHPSLHVAA